MTGWRQAVFVRQRRIDLIQRALSKILDEESWSPATPRRLHVGSADASSRGWTMVVPELANFFLDRGGSSAPRLCRLARELHCPAYEVDHTAPPFGAAAARGQAPVVDVRGPVATTLFEVDAFGRMRLSGAPSVCLPGVEVASDDVGFELLSIAGDLRERMTALDPRQPMAVADYLGALAGFPGWTRHGDDLLAIGAAGELIYEPPRIIAGAHARPDGRTHVTAGITARPSETRAASGRSTTRAVAPAHDRRGRRPRSAARPRR